jgi:N-acetylmuramoyl-L-alanine amidase
MEREARMHPLWKALPTVLVALVLGAGCGGHRPPGPPPNLPGPSPSPSTRPAPGYERRIDSLDVVDTSAVRGRRIVIDPGHGGAYKGALGVGGLTEAAVNLDVALDLERLLVARGAQVLMTRREDRDFRIPADSTLRGDLSERTRIANAFHPDLFLSVHHNADPGGTHDKNETQTYYKLGDEGASLDAAAGIHRFLKRNLGIQGQRLLPGNYFVLRNSEAPAVLTEASYITNPDVEARLALPEKRRLEAEALYLGIARFFSRGAPELASFEALDAAGRADTSFAESDGPTLTGVVRGAFDQAELTLDDQPLEPERRGDRISWRPSSPLPVGRHEALLRVSLAGTGSSRERRLSFRLERRAARLVTTAWPERPAALVGVRIEVLDRTGLPSLEPLRLTVRASRPGVAPAETTVTPRDGVAWAYLRLSRAARASSAPIARVTPTGSRATAPAASVSFTAGSAREPAAAWSGWARLEPSGALLRDALGTAEPNPRWSWINRDGFVALRRDSARGVPSLPGYRLAGADTLPPRFVAIAGGALHGRRIVLDPDGGGEDPGGMGESGTRGALYNMQVARALASLLVASGAEVALARSGDVAASDVERVRVSEAFHADRFLRIGHRPEPTRAGYYFSSAVGKAWAQRTAAWLARLGIASPPVAEDAQYPLQQTSCTAIYVSARRVDRPEDEAAMNAPGAVRAEAYALYMGLLEEWTGPKPWPVDTLAIRDDAGRPAPGALVTLGGALVLQADARGDLRFARTEEGPMIARVEHPGIGGRELLLDSAPGNRPIGPRGR